MKNKTSPKAAISAAEKVQETVYTSPGDYVRTFDSEEDVLLEVKNKNSLSEFSQAFARRAKKFKK